MGLCIFCCRFGFVIVIIISVTIAVLLLLVIIVAFVIACFWFFIRRILRLLESRKESSLEVKLVIVARCRGWCRFRFDFLALFRLLIVVATHRNVLAEVPVEASERSRSRLLGNVVFLLLLALLFFLFLPLAPFLQFPLVRLGNELFFVAEIGIGVFGRLLLCQLAFVNDFSFMLPLLGRFQQIFDVPALLLGLVAVLFLAGFLLEAVVGPVVVVNVGFLLAHFGHRRLRPFPHGVLLGQDLPIDAIAAAQSCSVDAGVVVVIVVAAVVVIIAVAASEDVLLGLFGSQVLGSGGPLLAFLALLSERDVHRRPNE
mmetsp:Transcript_27736/g.77711  ORF Transcript_27736/g.77711 Transcript_27736/m.77711 type:complete len:314 (+) Transcript_27736:1128-2069(+)